MKTMKSSEIRKLAAVHRTTSEKLELLALEAADVEEKSAEYFRKYNQITESVDQLTAEAFGGKVTADNTISPPALPNHAK